MDRKVREVREVREVSSDETRARLLQRERLGALGKLAAGIAHEINNPAAFLLLGIDLLDRLLHGPAVAMDPASTARAAELLHELRDATNRIVELSRDLRLFTSAPAAPSGRRAIIDVNRTVSAALNLVRGRILERAQIARSIEEVAPVGMDDGDLGQVIIGLLVRAAEAIPEEGARDHVITVATRSDGRTVTIEVRDTGDRLPREDLERLLRPASAADVDAGLELAIWRDIVERGGGEILVESPVIEGPDAARGTRFVIGLPVAAHPPR